MYGGRTQVFKLYHKCSDDKKIKYLDYTSLYPYIQKYGMSPIGHPTVITDNFNYTPNEPNLGTNLGEFTNEIDPEDGNYIKEWVSAGKKLSLQDRLRKNSLYSQGLHVLLLNKSYIRLD